MFTGVVYVLKCHCHPGAPPRYVGVSKNLHIRMSDHRKNARYGSKRPVYKWMRKHGIQNIDPVVLETVDSVEKMFALEKEYILQYRAAGVNLLNCTDGGEGTLGFRHSAEKYKEMAEKRRRENLSPETRKRLSESSKRENLSPDTRKRMSESHRGKTPAAKLTEDQVREIRKECLSNTSNIEIGKKYGLSRSSIANIRHRRTWSNLE